MKFQKNKVKEKVWAKKVRAIDKMDKKVQEKAIKRKVKLVGKVTNNQVYIAKNHQNIQNHKKIVE